MGLKNGGEGICYSDAGRRFKVGRSSSSDEEDGALLSSSAPTVPVPDPGARRSVGRLPSAGLSTLRLLCIANRRAFTSLNSEVVSTYSGLAFRYSWMFFWAASMRESVGGCVEKTLDTVPGLRFSKVSIFSKKSTKAVRIVPGLVHVFQAQQVRFRFHGARELQESYRDQNAGGLIDSIPGPAAHEDQRESCPTARSRRAWPAGSVARRNVRRFHAPSRRPARLHCPLSE